MDWLQGSKWLGDTNNGRLATESSWEMGKIIPSFLSPAFGLMVFRSFGPRIEPLDI
jgi:hypothetical protein